MVETRNGAATGYDPVAKALHWLIFVLLAAQFTVAWTMPHIGRNTKPETLINLHFSFGITIVFVVVLRLLWRLSHRVPPAASVPTWQRAAAHLLHGLLYLVLIVLPLMGWVSASMRGWPVAFYGVVTIPQIVATNSAVAGQLGDVHAAVGSILLILVGLHVAAVLYHVIRRDGVLQRMLPASQQPTAERFNRSGSINSVNIRNKFEMSRSHMGSNLQVIRVTGTVSQLEALLQLIFDALPDHRDTLENIKKTILFYLREIVECCNSFLPRIATQ